MAEALLYLHEHNIVHGNLKSSNVLMDKQWEPHLADYGLAQIALFYPNAKSSMTTYLAPELLSMGFHPEAANPSTDVYSFGMVLLEIVSGRKNVDVSRLVLHGDDESWYFPAFASQKF